MLAVLFGCTTWHLASQGCQSFPSISPNENQKGASSATENCSLGFIEFSAFLGVLLPSAQFDYAHSLFNGDGIWIDKSHSADYFKLAAMKIVIKSCKTAVSLAFLVQLLSDPPPNDSPIISSSWLETLPNFEERRLLMPNARQNSAGRSEPITQPQPDRSITGAGVA
jgi:hypothetical protein